MNFKKDEMNHHVGFAMLTLASLAMTLPFIFYAKDIADSLRNIAERRTLQ